MRTRFTQSPGVSFRAIGLPGSPMRGMEIDNPSGSYLLIPSLETWIAPYTMGWATSFPYDVMSIDIIAGSAPAGQVSTSSGDPVTVYLTDDPAIVPSPGTTTLIPTQQNFPTYTTWTHGGTPLLWDIPGVAGKRIRLYRVLVSAVPITSPGAFGATFSMDAAVGWELDDGPNNSLAAGTIIDQDVLTFDRSRNVHDFGRDGLDCPVVGNGLKSRTVVDWMAINNVFVVSFAYV